MPYEDIYNPDGAFHGIYFQKTKLLLFSFFMQAGSLRYFFLQRGINTSCIPNNFCTKRMFVPW